MKKKITGGKRAKTKGPTATPPSGLKFDHEDIEEFIQQHAEEVFSFKRLARMLNITTRDEKVELALVLQQMVKNDGLVTFADGTFQAKSGQKLVTGRVEFINPRFAWVVSDEVENDIRVTVDDLKWAQDGDIVKVRIYPYLIDRRPVGEVVEIITRSKKEFVGRIEVTKRMSYVVPDNKRAYFTIYIHPEDTLNAKQGDKVIVNIVDWGSAERNPFGVVTKVLGSAGENDTEMHAILAEFGLPIDFPEEVIQEAEKIPSEITAEEIAKRRDFRNILTFTIDPFDAKDFDDAISYRELENGNVEVGVHIADVTHYVQPNSELDKEAYRRGTSVYLVDRTVPMLPERLSNGLCSLRPKEEKLTFSAVFELNDKGKVLDQWFGRTIIYSDKRYTYEEAQEVLEGKDDENALPLRRLNAIAHQLKDERFRKGAIAFETPEVKFKLDEKGKPLAVIPKIRKDAHKLIEEYMLLANKKVAEFVSNLGKGNQKKYIVNRIHEHPNPEKIRVFSAFAKKFGYKLSLEQSEMSSSFNSFIDSLQGKPEEDVLQHLAVRTMAKARYSMSEIGHFGLAFKHYTHFTSPIRRYPDMMAHRMLQHYLDGGENVDVQWEEIRCRWNSDMEKKAAEAERASIKYKQVEFMESQEDKVFEGIVSGVTEWGFYVEVVDTKCEGLVRITDLKDDFYELDAENYRLIGKRTKRMINFGDKVEVKVKNTNLLKRQIDLKLVDEDLERYTSMQGARKKRTVRK